MKGREEETANTTTKISAYSPTSSSKKRFGLWTQVNLKCLTALPVGLILLRVSLSKLTLGIIIILHQKLNVKELH